jgi:uridine phosphorylase
MNSHIKVPAGDRNALVLTCGSPERAEWFSKFLEAPEVIAKNREYHSFYGKFKGKTILVLSHGVGSAGAAIAFSEVIQSGAKSIVRIGTAGGLYDKVQIGDIVVPQAAVREDGASRLMLPMEYPAVADMDLTQTLLKSIQKKSERVKSGVIVTSDLFYPGKLPSTLSLHQSMGAIAVEMECATLFTLGFIHGVKTAAAVVLDGNPLQHQEGVYDPSFDRLKASLEQCFYAAAETLTAE